MLLSQPEVVEALERDFVCAWESIRPVPRVTVDFGDGRVLQRTLAGNTVFYVCRPYGSVVDALPGVYTPGDFLEILAEARSLVQAEEAEVVEWHAREGGLARAEPTPVTVSKAVVESPLLEALDLDPARVAEERTSRYREAAMALKDLSKVPMDAAEVRAEVGGGDPVALDSRLNRERVRPVVHMLLATYERLPRPEECRDALFEEILHVPIRDPWLGLVAAPVPGTP